MNEWELHVAKHHHALYYKGKVILTAPELTAATILSELGKRGIINITIRNLDTEPWEARRIYRLDK